MGKCFIVDVQMGIWATGDQTLSHSPEVQWPSNCARTLVFSLAGVQAHWLGSCACSQTQTLHRGLIRPWKCNATSLILYELRYDPSTCKLINIWPTDPAQGAAGSQSTVRFGFWTDSKRLFLFVRVNQWPLSLSADFGTKWQGSVSWKCHFRIDLHQASSCVIVSSAWVIDSRRRKSAVISCFGRHESCFHCPDFMLIHRGMQKYSYLWSHFTFHHIKTTNLYVFYDTINTK